jgi:hypothetical protein
MIFPLGAQPQDTESQQASNVESQQAQTDKLACDILESLQVKSEFCKVGVGGGTVYVGKELFQQNGTANLINAKDEELLKKATALKTDYKATFMRWGATEAAAGVMAEDAMHLAGRPLVKYLGAAAVALGAYEIWQAGKTKTSSTNVEIPKAK